MDVTDIKKEFSRVKRRITELQKNLKKVGDLAGDASAPAFVLTTQLRDLKRRVDTFPRPGELLDRITRLVEEQEPVAQKALDDEKKRFGGRLARALKDRAGMELAGQYPNLQAGNFTIELRLDQGDAKLWWGPKTELLATCEATVDAVVDAVEKQEANLGAGLEVPAFLAQIRDLAPRLRATRATQATQATQSPHEAPDAPVPIHAVYLELVWALQPPAFCENPVAENFREYSRAAFSADLSRVHEELGKRAIDAVFRLQVASRAFTKKKRDSLWVPADATGKGTHYSHVIFRTGPEAAPESTADGREGPPGE